MTIAELELTTTSASTATAGTNMKALVYHGPGKRAWEDKARPIIQDPGDAIVRITTSTICGTDLHILKGDLPAVTDGRILGHEGIGVVEEVGPGVSEFHVGDKVIISCVSACLKCDFCKRSMYSHCRHGGWILGYTIDGTQAEYVRIPHADGSLYNFPADADEEAMVMLSDILPTGFECGVLNGQVKPGDTVAIVGAGARGARSSADRAILFTGGNLHDRFGRQAPGGGQKVRRNRLDQQRGWTRRRSSDGPDEGCRR